MFHIAYKTYLIEQTFFDLFTMQQNNAHGSWRILS